MDLKVIQELISMMENSRLSSMELEWKDMKIRMEKKDEDTLTLGGGRERTAEVKHYEAVTSSEAEVKKAEPAAEVKAPAVQGTAIKAPMVGTFYSAPSPDSEPFAAVGKKVSNGDVVCIIEAMKLMNEIESDCSGIIAEILVKDGDMVEYGQPLFTII
ncbi:MAG: acetyl-CoA carboxylase biotin carboxyl carrier protein [Bacillota bacterium]|nr:acetyl-CoA carboxylase biotin carboxyl carrier protein [Bacillota bacterium]